MSFEIALMGIYLGIALIQVFIAWTLSDKNWFFITIKIFLYASAIFMLYFASSLGLIMLEYNYYMGVITS